MTRGTTVPMLVTCHSSLPAATATLRPEALRGRNASGVNPITERASAAPLSWMAGVAEARQSVTRSDHPLSMLPASTERRNNSMAGPIPAGVSSKPRSWPGPRSPGVLFRVQPSGEKRGRILQSLTSRSPIIMSTSAPRCRSKKPFALGKQRQVQIGVVEHPGPGFPLNTDADLKRFI